MQQKFYMSVIEQYLGDDDELTILDFSNLHWYSDWNGYEVGYPNINVVGLYTDGLATNYYINSETGEILEQWEDDYYYHEFSDNKLNLKYFLESDNNSEEYIGCIIDKVGVK